MRVHKDISGHIKIVLWSALNRLGQSEIRASVNDIRKSKMILEFKLNIG